MNICPITYEPCSGLYSSKGLKHLSRRLTNLKRLPFTCQELRQEASARASKMSIQGVQPKLSAKLHTKEQTFALVDQGGHYIFKPQIADYVEVPENEDLTMRLAAMVGIDVPLHGLLYGKDNEMVYFIKRFDRKGHKKKLHVEDFAQLGNQTRETKYRSSMEQVAHLIEKYCTFPAVEKIKLFRLTLFSFLIGNEDMHLKNFSIIHNKDTITLSSAYDLLNTTIVLPRPEEELALPLNGKKNKLKREDIIDYFGSNRLGIPDRVINKILAEFAETQDQWEKLIKISFLSTAMKNKYQEILAHRHTRIFL